MEVHSSEVEDDVTWWPAADGERQAIRVDSRLTGGAYSVIESVARPDAAAPTHLHRNEEEHFLVLVGRYRIAVGDDVIEARPGDRIAIPRNVPHSWRNVSDGESRLVATLVPGGLEQIVYRLKDTPPEKLVELSAEYGCEILGPPAV